MSPTTMLANIGDYWVIIAMIFIAFFRWFFTERGRTAEEEQEFETFEEDPSQPPPVPGEARRTDESETAADLRKFLEQLAGGPAEPPPPPPVPAVPAIPVEQPREEPPRLTKVETEALERLKNQTDHYGAAPSQPRSRNSLHELLSNPANLQNAILLKEILDKPVALRERG